MSIKTKIIAEKDDKSTFIGSYNRAMELRLGWIAARQLNLIGRIDQNDPTFKELGKYYDLHKDEILVEGKCGKCLWAFQERVMSRLATPLTDQLNQLRDDAGRQEKGLTKFIEYANRFVLELDRIVKTFDYKEARRVDDEKMAEATLLNMLETFSRYFIELGCRVKIYRIDSTSSPCEMLAESFVMFDRDNDGTVRMTRDFWSRFAKKFGGIIDSKRPVIGPGEALFKAIKRPEEIIHVIGDDPLKLVSGEDDFHLRFVPFRYFPSMVIDVVTPSLDAQTKGEISVMRSPHFIPTMHNLIYTLQSALNTFDQKAMEILEAIIDKRTGLFAPNQFEEQVTRVVNASLRLKTPLSMAVMDLDHFKLCNELLGHDGGDKVLAFMGAMIRKHFRITSTDVAIRYGGEELVILMQNVTKEEAAALMEEFKEKLKDELVHIQSQVTLTKAVTYNSVEYPEGYIYPIAFSGGVSDVDDVLSVYGLSIKGSSTDELKGVNPPNLGHAMFKVADERLLYVKKHGRNRTIFEIPKTSQSGRLL